MRVIIFGAGAVGSVIGGRLAQTGANVVLVGRQAHVDAINAAGLRLRTDEGSETVAVAARTALDGLAPGDDDVVVITAKTQDTPAIHDALAAWNRRAAIVCATNGLEHERMALRRFPRVYGMLVQMPAQFEKPGEVTMLCRPVNAVLDVGRYPHGTDDTAAAIAATLETTGTILSEADPAIMVKKAGKLLVNLGNASEAAAGFGARFEPVAKAAAAEARRVYAAAGVPFEITDHAEAARYATRMKRLEFHIPDGDTFVGGSTWQGLAKGAGSAETDYFNGEIALLGRLHGTPTPHNEFLQALVDDLIAQRVPPGTMTTAELHDRWVAATGGDTV